MDIDQDQLSEVQDSTDGDDVWPDPVYLFSFDQTGFEAIVNLTEIHNQEVYDTMIGKKPVESVNSIIQGVSLRCQFNGERRMEAWIVKLPRDWTDPFLKDLAEESPQVLVDLIRKHGEIVGGQDFSKLPAPKIR